MVRSRRLTTCIYLHDRILQGLYVRTIHACCAVTARAALPRRGVFVIDAVSVRGDKYRYIGVGTSSSSSLNQRQTGLRHVRGDPHHGIHHGISRFTRRGVGGVKINCKPACVPAPPLPPPAPAPPYTASRSTNIGWLGVRLIDTRESFSSPSAASSEPRSESDCDDVEPWWRLSSAMRRCAARVRFLARRRRMSRCMSAAPKRITRVPERTPASATAVKGYKKKSIRKSAIAIRSRKLYESDLSAEPPVGQVMRTRDSKPGLTRRND